MSLSLWLLFAAAPAGAQPNLHADATQANFGRVSAAAKVQQEFRIRNTGDAPLRIERMALTPPLRVERMPAQIAPGAEMLVRVRLDTASLQGNFAGNIVLFTNDPSAPETTLSLSGEVLPTIELVPRPAFFLAGNRGEHASASIDIVNHETQPLRLESPAHDPAHFSTKLETIAEGDRYRLTIALKPDGPGGKHSGDIAIKTSSHTMPVITIPANTWLRERVYTFPDAVDLGSLRRAEVRSNPELLRRNAQTLMVYQTGGKDFTISVTSDIAGLDVKAVRGPQGDRQQLTVTFDPRKALEAGAIRGNLFIKTNDPDFPRLVVPVSGDIIG